MPKQKLFVFGLILLVGFLVLPGNSLADDIDDIELRELGKELKLSERNAQDLIWSLISVFHSEWVDLMVAPYSTPEERAVPSVMKKAVQIQALNHLLTDAPFQVTVGIVKNSVKIGRLLVAQDVSTLVSELEKESVKKATEYGMNFLLENEIRTAPGAINFEYETKGGDEKQALLQYVMLYKPSGGNRGEVLIRFYSTDPLEPPESKGGIGYFTGTYTELTNNLSPFTVDIRGDVENFMWVDKPSVAIEFPEEVPDLGIRPLNFLERNVLKPIVTRIKDVEVIITKVVGEEPLEIAGNFTDKLSGFVSNVWDAIKSRILQQVKLPGGAGVGETTLEIVPRTEEEKRAIVLRSELRTGEEEVGQEVGQDVGLDEEDEEIENPGPPTPEELAILQRQVDEAARMVEALNLQVQELVETQAEEKQEEKEVDEQELEDEEELDEQEQKEKLAQEQKEVCPLEVNSASAEELDLITGVGPVIAQRIIEARPFGSIDDLTRVSGIGTKRLQDIIDQGCAYVSAPSGGLSSASSGQEEEQEEEQESEPAKNLLANEFFEDWINPPKYWDMGKHTGDAQKSSQALRGASSLNIKHSFVGLRNIEQHLASTTVDLGNPAKAYGEVRVKGTGYIRIGIKAGQTNYSHSAWQKLDDVDWTSVKHERSTTDSENIWQFRIQTSRRESAHSPPENPHEFTQIDLQIGAAWLGTALPPATWPMGEPPNKVKDFVLDSQNSYSNRAALTWATSTDSDTLSEDLAYKIYYSTSTQGHLTEDDLEDPGTESATTTQTTITLTDLDFNSTYYFGIKAYDPENNLSALATTTSYKTATLGVIYDNFSVNLTIDNNGRKIVRASNGTLYTVYDRSGSSRKVYLANSTDGGLTWAETEITSDADQKNPSIAIDSQNNLHIAWQGIVSTSTSTKYQIRYRKYSAGSFSAIENFTADIDKDQKIPFVAVDSQNKIHLAWVGLGAVASSTGDSLYYVKNSGGSWGSTETVKKGEFHPDFGKSLLQQFALAADSQDILHFIWLEHPPVDAKSLRYRKVDPSLSSEDWSAFEKLTNAETQNQPSIAVDSQNSLHIVWGETKSGTSTSTIYYLKCSGACNSSDIDTLNEEKNSDTRTHLSAAIDSDDNVYVVWKRGDIKPLSQGEYKNGDWQDVKTLIDGFDYGAFTNMLWSINNQPATGYAFVFYEGTDLKFYGSEDLTW